MGTIKKMYEFEETLTEAIDKKREEINKDRVEHGKKAWNEVEFLSELISENINHFKLDEPKPTEEADKKAEEAADALPEEAQPEEPDLNEGEELSDEEKADENRDPEE